MDADTRPGGTSELRDRGEVLRDRGDGQLVPVRPDYDHAAELAERKRRASRKPTRSEREQAIALARQALRRARREGRDCGASRWRLLLRSARLGLAGAHSVVPRPGSRQRRRRSCTRRAGRGAARTSRGDPGDPGDPDDIAGGAR